MKSVLIAATEMQIRVSYADTDQMGMVYYGNYLTYFERGRTEWLRQRGFSYKEMEMEGILLPVIECSCRYISPARYDDMITVRTGLTRIGPASIEFGYEVVRDSKVITTGFTKHPVVNREFRPVRIPEKIAKILSGR